MSKLLIVYFLCYLMIPEVWLYRELSDNPFVRLNRSIEDINDEIIRARMDKIKYNETYTFGEMVYYVLEVELGPGVFGDFGSFKLDEQPNVNVKERKDEKGRDVTVFHYDMVLTLGFLFFDFDYGIKTLGLSWGYSEFMIDAKRNSFAAELEVWVWNDGSCKAMILGAKVLQVSHFVVTIQPRTFLHYFTNPVISAITEAMVPRLMVFLNDKMKEVVEEIIPNSSFSESVCVHYAQK